MKSFAEFCEHENQLADMITLATLAEELNFPISALCQWYFEEGRFLDEVLREQIVEGIFGDTWRGAAKGALGGAAVGGVVGGLPGGALGTGIGALGGGLWGLGKGIFNKLRGQEGPIQQQTKDTGYAIIK